MRTGSLDLLALFSFTLRALNTFVKFSSLAKSFLNNSIRGLWFSGNKSGEVSAEIPQAGGASMALWSIFFWMYRKNEFVKI